MATQCSEQPPDEGGEHGPVRPIQARSWVDAAQDCELVPQHHELDVLSGERTTHQAQRSGQAPEMGPERGVVTVGLVATPPDHPARVAERLTRELPGLLAARVDRDVRWEVRSGWGAVAPRRDGGVDALLDDVARRRRCGCRRRAHFADAARSPARARRAGRRQAAPHVLR
jgi:hypothetical protein